MKTNLTATLIILFLIWIVIEVFAVAHAYEPYEVRKPTWDMPDIAQCDKPLWDRIRTGCGDNDE